MPKKKNYIVMRSPAARETKRRRLRQTLRELNPGQKQVELNASTIYKLTTSFVDKKSMIY